MIRLSLSLVMAAVVSGCTLYGARIPKNSVEAIQLNVTTQEQVYSTFGKPIQAGTDSGFETWRYSFRGFSDDAEWLNRDLYIIFNKNKTVHKYSFSTNKPAIGQ
ncbi:MAG TPA: outer membrane protein assembly factor BamE [Candidatus Binatia bacterium]